MGTPAWIEERTNPLRNEWPVKTGDSLDAFDLDIAITRRRIFARVRNPVNYFYYIRGRRQGGKSSWQEVIRKPALKRVPDLAKRCADEWRKQHEKG